MILVGNAGQKQVPTLHFSLCDPSVMGPFGGEAVEAGLELKDARFFEERRLGMLKRSRRLGLAKLETEGVPLDRFAALTKEDVGDHT